VKWLEFCHLNVLYQFKTISTMETTPNSNKHVMIEIELTHSSNVIQYLVTNNVPFLMSYKGVSPEPETEKLKTEQGFAKAAFKNTLDTQSPIERFYEKYILNITDSPLPPMEELARDYGRPALRLQRDFKTKYGETIYSLYLKKRMEKATKLLKQGYRAIEVKSMIGYGENSDIKFNKMFQKHFGITPKKYQMEHLKRGGK